MMQNDRFLLCMKTVSDINRAGLSGDIKRFLWRDKQVKIFNSFFISPDSLKIPRVLYDSAIVSHYL